eukprot:TRINITY_DN7027_c0_g1_i1.p1 TRINITY_DN7027_c0_g1~~TRINITY_DN7027_c0_g1_i1.p1  ORF type:complete len:1109 (+),score=208.74 TRINITY_DN7027_c0_g1_i1:1546-4872(+)
MPKFMESPKDNRLLQNRYWQQSSKCRSRTAICCCPLTLTSEDISWDDSNKEWIQLGSKEVALGMSRTGPQIWQSIIDKKGVGINKFNDALRHIIKYPSPDNVWGPNESGDSNSHVGCSESLGSDVSTICSVCHARKGVFRCSDGHCDKHAHLFCALLHTKLLPDGWVATFNTAFDETLPAPTIFCPLHRSGAKFSKPASDRPTSASASSSPSSHLQLFLRRDQYSPWRNRILPGGGVPFEHLKQASEWRVLYTGTVTNDSHVKAKIIKVPYRAKNSNYELYPGISKISPDDETLSSFHTSKNTSEKKLLKKTKEGYSVVINSPVRGSLSNLLKLHISAEDSKITLPVIRSPSDMTVSLTKDAFINEKMDHLRKQIYPRILSFMLGSSSDDSNKSKGFASILYGEGNKRVVLSELSISDRLGDHNCIFVDGSSVPSTHMVWRRVIETHYPRCAAVIDFEKGGDPYQLLQSILSDKYQNSEDNAIINPVRYRTCDVSLHPSFVNSSSPTSQFHKYEKDGSFTHTVLDSSCLSGRQFDPHQSVVIRQKRRVPPPPPPPSQIKRQKEGNTRDKGTKSLFSGMLSKMGDYKGFENQQVRYPVLEMFGGSQESESESFKPKGLMAGAIQHFGTADEPPSDINLTPTPVGQQADKAVRSSPTETKATTTEVGVSNLDVENSSQRQQIADSKPDESTPVGALQKELLPSNNDLLKDNPPVCEIQPIVVSDTRRRLEVENDSLLIQSEGTDAVVVPPTPPVEQVSNDNNIVNDQEMKYQHPLQESTSLNTEHPLKTAPSSHIDVQKEEVPGVETDAVTPQQADIVPPETPCSQKTSAAAPTTERHPLQLTPSTEPKKIQPTQTMLDRLKQKRPLLDEGQNQSPVQHRRKATEHISETEAQLDASANKQLAIFIHDVEQAPMTFLTHLNELYKRNPTKIRICASVIDSKKAQLLAVTVLKNIPIQFVEASTFLPETIERVSQSEVKKGKSKKTCIDDNSSWVSQFKSIASSGSAHANVMLWLLALLQHRSFPAGVPMSTLMDNACKHLSFSKTRDDVQHHLHIYMDHKVVLKSHRGREELFVIPVSQPDTLQKVQRELQDCVGEFYGDELRPQRIPQG